MVLGEFLADTLAVGSALRGGREGGCFLYRNWPKP